MAEYASREEEEGFDSTQVHGELLIRATGGIKKGRLKGLDIHTHPQDVGVSTSRRDSTRPPIYQQTPQVEEMQNTIHRLEEQLNQAHQRFNDLSEENRNT
ncbi:hypothetical protein SLA2020_188780 [Shorea laevis]